MLTLLLATPAIAGPNQIDILGLIPGVSDSEDIKRVAVRDGGRAVMLEIGGHSLPCIPSYIDNKLSGLVCLTGKNGGTRYTDESNTTIHVELWAGFAKKFGKVDAIDKSRVRTVLGSEHEKSTVMWKDKKGNILRLVSIFDSVTSGAIEMYSNEHLKNHAENRATREANKKF